LRNEPLRDALRRLPAETASGDFSARVLARLDDPPPRSAILRLAPVAGMLLLAAVAFPMAWHLMNPAPEVPGPASAAAQPAPTASPPPSADRAAQRARARAELAALRAEGQRLDQDWRQYRRLAREVEPVLYLGGNENVDVLLDLQRVPPEALRGDVVPAAMNERSFQP